MHIYLNLVFANPIVGKNSIIYYSGWSLETIGLLSVGTGSLQLGVADYIDRFNSAKAREQLLLLFFTTVVFVSIIIIIIIIIRSSTNHHYHHIVNL